ncbi:MAG: glycosyltransferase family 4 protein [bacterium]|nr:glycosyltransferase family 4 protein [bacterium]
MSKIILISHKYSTFYGGIERYIFDTVSLMKDKNYTVYGLFEDDFNECSKQFITPFDKVFSLKDNDIYTILSELKNKVVNVFIHKLYDIKLFRFLQDNFITTLFVHDHDYYCMRGHKYYSFNRKNCYRAFNTCFCTICARPLYRDVNGKVRFKSAKPFFRKKLLDVSRKCDMFVVLSEHMRNNLILNKYPESKIKKIYPIINISENLNIKGNDNEILFIGQLIRGKGVDLLLDSLKKMNLDFKLNIVGKGNDESFIKNLIHEYKLEDKVNMVGFTLETDKWYDSASLVAVPSRWQEPFGLIGGEAYSHFKPVVAFDVGGISEWLKDGVNGFLVNEYDTKTFAEKIEFLLTHKNKSEKMGIAGNSFMKENFTADKFISEIKHLIGDI